MDVAKKAAELKALLKGMKDDDTEEMEEDEEVRIHLIIPCHFICTYIYM